MPHLLSKEPITDRPDPEPEVVGLDSRGSEDVFSVLASESARSILVELYRDPATKSELAARVGTSIQNVSHHLENLSDAGLVTVIDEWYSEKGREMDVYAPESSPFVLVVGEQDAVSDARRSIASKPTPQLGD
ncbi:ArsR/SmtB family transcription factor [Halobellus ordinarius]|uniref:ArsR/SmtB family transcription factor n=1 Tax=Halobellus ordinarius TaxID=3075120 RepID=UPI00288084E8|nr:helix-turn-helix domain-containing protein [Halobellus sp. ZY16]